RDSPALQHPVPFKAKVIMERAGSVLLNDEFCHTMLLLVLCSLPPFSLLSEFTTRFPGVDSEGLMLSHWEDSDVLERSRAYFGKLLAEPVLKAMGLSGDGVASSIRISWEPGVDSISTAAVIEAIQSLEPLGSVLKMSFSYITADPTRRHRRFPLEGRPCVFA